MRNLGLVAVTLAAIAIAAIIVDVRKGHSAKPVDKATAANADVLDKMVVDYAFQTLEGLTKSAVTSCGIDLVGQEADVTVKVRIEGPVMKFSDVRFGQSTWTNDRKGCVTKTFEGAERSPASDGVATKFPDGSEYEVDAHLSFLTPTLQYNQ